MGLGGAGWAATEGTWGDKKRNTSLASRAPQPSHGSARQVSSSQSGARAAPEVDARQRMALLESWTQADEPRLLSSTSQHCHSWGDSSPHYRLCIC